ncbi:MAG: helix-turn-helix transcriptional regulator [Oscillospiraceae bacterium]|nr:helix-turn-helix transcriptional regulator [Oscillospiraceae bacterium]
MHYVELLRELRKANGLTQAQVAEYLHLDRSTYAYYESGRTKINIDMLMRLADFYRVGLAALVGDRAAAPAALSDDMESNRTAVLINDSVARFSQLSREEQYLVILFRSGDGEKRQRLIKAATALVSDED